MHSACHYQDGGGEKGRGITGKINRTAKASSIKCCWRSDKSSFVPISLYSFATSLFSLLTLYQILRRLLVSLVYRAECGTSDYYYPKSTPLLLFDPHFGPYEEIQSTHRRHSSPMGALLLGLFAGTKYARYQHLRSA